jgi:hypothetical protein
MQRVYCEVRTELILLYLLIIKCLWSVDIYKKTVFISNDWILIIYQRE